MSAYPDSDLTLPSVVAALPGNYRQRELVLTIVFHPDTTRIGERAIVPRRGAGARWLLGRRSPAFSRNGSSSQRPLDEAHVSRQALALLGSGDSLTIQRLPASSRCRIGGRELDTVAELDQEQLRAGIPILLGHSVVLLLRLTAPATAGEPAAAFTTLRGSSTYMLGLREQIARAAGSELDVLIRGETGTGKELVAEAIHSASRRSGAALINVNMAAIPSGLAAASLFGNTRGAFTGASKASEGYFRQAQGGTLFLDEIGDTPEDVQPQLLRALQQREIQAVGGPVRHADLRVISATDAALEGEHSDFKAALRHRLGAFEIVLSPLRDHPEDIGELLLHFLMSANAEAGSALQLPGEITAGQEIAAWAELFHHFVRYDWPGNVRELANFARQVALASTSVLTLPDHLNVALRGEGGAPQPPVPSKAEGSRRKMQDIDASEFDAALQLNRYEVAATARQLRVSRQAVYRRLQESPGYRLAGQVPLAELESALAQQGGNARAAALQLQVSLSGLHARLRNSALPWF